MLLLSLSLAVALHFAHPLEASIAQISLFQKKRLKKPLRNRFNADFFFFFKFTNDREIFLREIIVTAGEFNKRERERKREMDRDRERRR